MRFALDRRAGTAVAAALDRRLGNRHPVRPEDGVSLQLRNDLGELREVEPLDLSETGLALRLAAHLARDLESEVSDPRELQLLLSLPGSAPLSLRGLVRRRTLEGDAAVYAVEFDSGFPGATALAAHLAARAADRRP